VTQIPQDTAVLPNAPRAARALSTLAVAAVLADFLVLAWALLTLPSDFRFDPTLWRPWLINAGTVSGALAFALAGSLRRWPRWTTVLIMSLIVVYSYFFVTNVLATATRHLE
jgi:Ca2+/Na+ antiporter